MKTVKIVRVPGAVVEVAVEDNATVADCLAATPETLSTEGYEIRIGDLPATLTHVPSCGSRIVLVKEVKGN